jgi:hypothetical protein
MNISAVKFPQAAILSSKEKVDVKEKVSNRHSSIRADLTRLEEFCGVPQFVVG